MFLLREFEWGIDNRGIECHYLMGFFYDEGIKAKMIHLHTRVSFGIKNFFGESACASGEGSTSGISSLIPPPLSGRVRWRGRQFIWPLCHHDTRDIDFIDWIFLIRNLSRWHCIINPTGKCEKIGCRNSARHNKELQKTEGPINILTVYFFLKFIFWKVRKIKFRADLWQYILAFVQDIMNVTSRMMNPGGIPCTHTTWWWKEP